MPISFAVECVVLWHMNWRMTHPPPLYQPALWRCQTSSPAPVWRGCPLGKCAALATCHPLAQSVSSAPCQSAYEAQEAGLWPKAPKHGELKTQINHTLGFTAGWLMSWTATPKAEVQLLDVTGWTEFFKGSEPILEHLSVISAYLALSPTDTACTEDPMSTFQQEKVVEGSW